eukprot:maker-scaffold199_size265817-snap-gene-1.57 protein:Tk08950 transcript:maker-scaffold199_size265817-snap-gene-1.57-mRNA-1 annotation:"hypothetical protein DAPPUDRAFT_60476"
MMRWDDPKKRIAVTLCFIGLLSLTFVSLSIYSVPYRPQMAQELEGQSPPTQGFHHQLVDPQNSSHEAISSGTNLGGSENKSSPVKLKTILFYTDAYGMYDYFVGAVGREAFQVQGCPDEPCFITSNRSLVPMDQFDALIFHPRANSFRMSAMPPKRSPHQRYIMWIIESGCYPSVHLPKTNNFFNWTMSYRADSDIGRPYGWFRPSQPLPSDATQAQLITQSGRTHRHLAQGKTKLVAWFVSNCHTVSNREAYIKELQKQIPVDIFGRCGTHQCSPKEEGNCMTMVDQDYKFYLSFENSLSLDYVTEKLFKVMVLNVIPVTFNSGQRIGAPKHSVIDATRFTPADLAAYLKKVAADDALFAEYMWWKDYYTVETKSAEFCQLCRMLNNPLQPPKVYSSMQKWWVDDAKCSRWTDNHIIPARHWPIHRVEQSQKEDT